MPFKCTNDIRSKKFTTKIPTSCKFKLADAAFLGHSAIPSGRYQGPNKWGTIVGFQNNTSGSGRVINGVNRYYVAMRDNLIWPVSSMHLLTKEEGKAGKHIRRGLQKSHRETTPALFKQFVKPKTEQATQEEMKAYRGFIKKYDEKLLVRTLQAIITDCELAIAALT